MTKASRLMAIVLYLSAAACGGASFRALAAPPHPLTPKRPEAVEVAAGPAAARKPVEIGRIEAESSAHPPTDDGRGDVLARLREVAGQHGCDVIVLSRTTESLLATSNGTPLYTTLQAASCFVYP